MLQFLVIRNKITMGNKSAKSKSKSNADDTVSYRSAGPAPTENDQWFEEENITTLADIDSEDAKQYRKGGYHPVNVDDLFKNRYQAIRKIGWGSSATVWRCKDLRKKRYVALKIVKSAPVLSKLALDEIELLKSAAIGDINDPNRDKITHLLHDFKIHGVNGTHICMVFELHRGSDLLTYTQQSENQKIELINVKKIIKQVLEGLNYLHNKCLIIHTDIKPENILISVKEEKICKVTTSNQLMETEIKTTEFIVKIADLGSACRVKTPYFRGIQTVNYRCPEIIFGSPIDPTADVWSTACMAFELATGCYLFDPVPGRMYSLDENHLAQMIQLFGKIPICFALSGRYYYDYFNLQGQLRHFKNIKQDGITEKLTRELKFNVDVAQDFVNFLQLMLALDPITRVSVQDCIRHKWLQF